MLAKMTRVGIKRLWQCCLCLILMFLFFKPKELHTQFLELLWPESVKQQCLFKCLDKIPKPDRQGLELFFRSCLGSDSFGYTLFGNKPMAVMGYCDILPRMSDVDQALEYISYAFQYENLIKIRGWEYWKKYQSLFKVRDYAFSKTKNFVNNQYSLILFINKKAFLEVVQEHLKDFQSVLGSNTTAELLLERVLHSSDVFADVLKGHQGLIGTILGYGRNNAWLFHSMDRLDPIMKQTFRLKKTDVNPHIVHWNGLNEQLKPFYLPVTYFNPFGLGFPRFAADPNTQETKRLKLKYLRQYREIIDQYRQGDFLEVTLCRMTSNECHAPVSNRVQRP